MECRLHMRQVGGAFWCQFDAARQPPEETGPEVYFQQLDMLADSGLGQPEFRACCREIERAAAASKERSQSTEGRACRFAIIEIIPKAEN